MADESVNLIDNRSVTAALIADPLAWRIRVVEEISLDAATHCQRRRSLQVAPLREMLDGHLTGSESEALLALNVAPIERGPLMDFDVEGPLGDAWLLPRTEIAAREALYLENLASSCGQSLSAAQREVLTAVLGFTGSRWFVDASPIPFADYMADGLGRQVPDDGLDRWRAIGESCRAVLRHRLDVFKGYSAPENPALVLPALFSAGLVVDDDEATAWLTEYQSLLDDINRKAVSGQPDAAAEFLDALADYGNHYDLVVAMRVPLDEPFLVKYSERRSLQLSALTNMGSQALVIADAHTNHVTFKITDPNVRIAAFQASQPGNDDYAFGAFLSRSDQQTRSFYAHDPDRDYRVRLVFRLALLRRLQFVPYFVSALLAALAVALLIERPVELRDLALIVGPSALAASILLAREPSTLGSRLRFVSSLLLAGSVLGIVGAALGLYVWGAVVGSSN